MKSSETNQQAGTYPSTARGVQRNPPADHTEPDAKHATRAACITDSAAQCPHTLLKCDCKSPSVTYRSRTTHLVLSCRSWSGGPRGQCLAVNSLSVDSSGRDCLASTLLVHCRLSGHSSLQTKDECL